MRRPSLPGFSPRLRRWLAVATLAATPAAADPLRAAEPLRLEIDPSASAISFVLGGNTHTVHGSFQITSGRVLFNPGDGSLSGEIVADASSGTAENPKVVKRMHKEVLEVTSFPEIVFRPEKLELSADGGTHAELPGSFDIHGTSHNLTFPIDVLMDAERVTATAELEIPYVAWGIKDPSRFVFRSAKQVQVQIRLVGRVVPYPVATNER